MPAVSGPVWLLVANPAATCWCCERLSQLNLSKEASQYNCGIILDGFAVRGIALGARTTLCWLTVVSPSYIPPYYLWGNKFWRGCLTLFRCVGGTSLGW